MKKLHDIELTVCPDLLSKQKQFLLNLCPQDGKGMWTDEMWECLDGLINLLDYIEDQINDIAH